VIYTYLFLSLSLNLHIQQAYKYFRPFFLYSSESPTRGNKIRARNDSLSRQTIIVMALTSFHLLPGSVNFCSESTHLISLRQFTLRAPRWHLRGRKSFKRTIKEMFECSCMLAPALPLSLCLSPSLSLPLSLSLSLSHVQVEGVSMFCYDTDIFQSLSAH